MGRRGHFVIYALDLLGFFRHSLRIFWHIRSRSTSLTRRHCISADVRFADGRRHDFYLLCFLARRPSVPVLFLQRPCNAQGQIAMDLKRTFV